MSEDAAKICTCSISEGICRYISENIFEDTTDAAAYEGEPKNNHNYFCMYLSYLDKLQSPPKHFLLQVIHLSNLLFHCSKQFF